MFQEGDSVIVEATAEEDCHYQAWKHIQQRKGIVRKVSRAYAGDNPQAAPLCYVEFDAPFAGGIDCHGTCKPRHGQFIMANNLSLCFEESRNAVTVPNVGG